MHTSENTRVKNAILDAIDYFGGSKAELARAIGVSNPMIDHWVSFRSPVSIKRALKIEKITKGSVKAADLVEWLPDSIG